MPIASTDFQNLARAVSAYSDEAYTGARKLISTALVGSDARISGSDEDYFGTIRYYKPLGDTLQYDGSDDTTGAATVVNIATQASTEGAKTSISTVTEQYIKTVRTHGADQYNVQRVISGEDGLSKIARDFGETRARDADAALRAVMNSVARAEVERRSGTGTGQNSPDSVQNLTGATNQDGFFVDLGNTTVQGFYSGNAGELIDDAQTSTAAKVSPLLAAMSIGYKDLEPDFFYLVTSPAQYLKMRQANLIDEQNNLQDGNVQFETILGGKIRLIVTRGTALNLSADSGVNSGSVQTSFLCQPGAIAMLDIDVPNPVAFDRDESVGRGTGTVESWYRWGYVMHPRGYNWAGATNAFVSNTSTQGTKASIASYESTNATIVSPFERVVDPLNLGILPIFHAA